MIRRGDDTRHEERWLVYAAGAWHIDPSHEDIRMDRAIPTERGPDVFHEPEDYEP